VPVPETYSYPRYLRAKETVDDRALNQHVEDHFYDQLTARTHEPLRLLEIGAGVGATAKRIVHGLSKRNVRALNYSLIDVTPENVDVARNDLLEWGRDHGYDVWGTKEKIVFSGQQLDVSFDVHTGDFFEFARDYEGEPYDAVIAQAVLDIVDPASALNVLRPLLKERGFWYLPIHFDGITVFEPPIDTELDVRIERLYHESMTGGNAEETSSAEDSRGGAVTGRRLLSALHSDDAHLVAAGSSDWVVFAADGTYTGDEAYFLHHILHFIEMELQEHPDLDATAFANWLQERRRQIESGELIYLAHQLDILAQETS